MSDKRPFRGFHRFCPQTLLCDGKSDIVRIQRQNGQITYMTAIGYARVSTGDQDTALQLDALRKAGCEKLFEDRASGVKTDRPGLAEAIRYVRDGDTLTVWKLDRLGRSMKHLIEIITELEAKDVGFRSITENIDTTTSGGRLVFHLFGALAQFERDLIRERTRAGLQAAEERGRRGGRQAVVTPEKLAKAQQHLAAGLNVREAAARVKIGKTALYEALKAEKLCEIQKTSGASRREVE
jgi:DNA invertase Pin-like site-specific DNA recombinase